MQVLWDYLIECMPWQVSSTRSMKIMCSDNSASYSKDSYCISIFQSTVVLKLMLFSPAASDHFSPSTILLDALRKLKNLLKYLITNLVFVPTARALFRNETNRRKGHYYTDTPNRQQTIHIYILKSFLCRPSRDVNQQHHPSIVWVETKKNIGQTQSSSYTPTILIDPL